MLPNPWEGLLLSGQVEFCFVARPREGSILLVDLVADGLFCSYGLGLCCW